MKKKQLIRLRFRLGVFERDKFTCKTCDTPGTEETLDAHHITDRNEMPNGGYILENGITLCEDCHKKAEVFHSSRKTEWEEGYHPDDLYKLIDSSYEKAYNKDTLKGI